MDEKKEQEVKDTEVKETEVKTAEVDSKNEVKAEAKQTVNQVKEHIKDVNFKEDAKATKGFVMELIKNPIEEIKNIVNDEKNSKFKIAILLVCVWMVASLIPSLKGFDFKDFLDEILNIVKDIIVPVLVVGVSAAIAFFMTRKSENKKSLITLLTVFTTAKLPIIVADVLGLLTLISYEISTITVRIGYFASAIACVMTFFAIKEIFGKDEKETFKTFVIFEAIYFVVSIALKFLGIYMY